jgi:hypothetical protein
MSVDGNLWYVKLADGDVERVTLDQLDEAFQGGQIDENSMVLAAGSEKWMRLADLLGLADATPPPPPPTPTPQNAVPTRTVPVPAMQQAAFARPPAAAQPFGTMRPPAGMPVIPVASSLRPVSFDLGAQIDFGDVQYPRPSRKRWVVGALGTALVLGVGAFFVVTRTAGGNASADTSPPTFAAAAALPPPAPPPPPVAIPTPAQVTNAGPSPVMDPTQQHLTDAQREKLLEADKKMKASHPKSHGGGGGGTSTSPPRPKSTSFTTTGSKYDPLNSSL